jgi:hypothetical protein
MTKMIIPLDKFWRLSVDPESPTSMEIAREDGRFYRIVFDTQRYGLPILVEAVGADGIAGRVIPIVRKSEDGEWQVAVSFNERPANNYTQPLMEGSRASASNTDPLLSSHGHPIRQFGNNFSNSARIQGTILFGVVDATDLDFELPASGQWVTFRDFSKQSTDCMVKACLFDLILQGIC